MSRSSLTDIALLAAPLLAAWVAFAPLGAYPSNDDFLYARPVELLVEHGQWRQVTLGGELAASAVGQIVWGAMFCWPAGFSFRTLHLSALVLSWLGAASAYALARMVHCQRSIALLLGATLLFNPFVFGHSFGYMTDAPAAAMMSISLYLYAVGLRSGSNRWLLAGSLVTAIGIWTRQTNGSALIVPAVVLAGRAIADRNWRSAALPMAAALAIPLFGAALLESGLILASNTRRLSVVAAGGFDRDRAHQLAIAGYGALVLTGFMLLPLLPFAGERFRRQVSAANGSRAGLVLGAIPGLLALAGFVKSRGESYITNATGYFLQNAHLGPILVSDSLDPGRWGDMGQVEWSPWVWRALTLLSIANVAAMGGLALAWAPRILAFLKPDSRQDNRDAAAGDEQTICWMELGLLLTAAALIVVPAVALESTFDRYWIAAIPPLLGWWAIQLRGIRWHRSDAMTWGAALALLAVFAGISVVFTHDYLAWNQARWRLVEGWLADDLDPKQIDGGYEVNGWFRSAEDPDTSRRPGDIDSRWWSAHAERFVTIGPRPGHTVVAQQRWFSWAMGQERVLYGLAKDP